jgi:Mannan-binding protein
MSTYKLNIPAGPLWSNEEAQKIGSNLAASYGAKFTGQWRTITEGVMSVIEIEYRY